MKTEKKQEVLNYWEAMGHETEKKKSKVASKEDSRGLRREGLPLKLPMMRRLRLYTARKVDACDGFCRFCAVG